MGLTVERYADKWRQFSLPPPPPPEEIEQLVSEFLKKDRCDQIGSYLGLFESHARAMPLWRSTLGEPPEVFWRVMMQQWNTCDAISRLHKRLLYSFREYALRASPLDFMEAEDLAFFRSLPDEIEIFRGCGRRKVRRMSWTTDRSRAEYFASGGRYPTPHDPVVARAYIEKAHLFFATTSRKESELVIDPSRITRLKLDGFDVKEFRSRHGIADPAEHTPEYWQEMKEYCAQITREILTQAKDAALNT